MEELIPLDDERRQDYSLWLSLAELERGLPAAARSSMWDDQRMLCRAVVLAGRPRPFSRAVVPRRDRGPVLERRIVRRLPPRIHLHRIRCRWIWSAGFAGPARGIDDRTDDLWVDVVAEPCG